MSDELKNTMADEEQAPEQQNDQGAEISEQELDQASGGRFTRAA